MIWGARRPRFSYRGKPGGLVWILRGSLHREDEAEEAGARHGAQDTMDSRLQESRRSRIY